MQQLDISVFGWVNPLKLSNTCNDSVQQMTVYATWWISAKPLTCATSFGSKRAHSSAGAIKIAVFTGILNLNDLRQAHLS